MIHKTTRSILSVLLAVLLLVTSTPLTPAFAGEGAVSLQSESGERGELKGSGTEDAPYQIGSAADLREFADKVNNQGQTSAWAELTADIDLNNQPWTPIGNSRPYSGNFNGNGHTISGLYINSSSANDQGLFGYVGTFGTVKDLSVSGSVSGGMCVGGIAGQNNGNVEDCDFTGSVSGSDHVGGVVGWNISGGNVKNCYNAGEVSGSSYVGGVVGENLGSSTVENCYNTGTVTGSPVGGVVGSNSFSATVTNCYNTGTVSGPDSGTGNRVGGVVGYNSGIGPVKNCYNTGTVTGTDDYVGGVVGHNDVGGVTNCYNTGEVSGNQVGGVVGLNNGPVTGCYFLQDTAEKGIGGGKPSEENVKSLTAKEFADQSNLSSWDFASTWEIEPIFGRPTLQDNAEIGGTANNPYKIFTATQLAAFRDLVNGGGAGASAHAKLMENIDLEGSETNPWTPIGSSSSRYSGTFDGNGHTISGLYIDSSSDNHQGLFGRVDGGTVKDLSVSGSVKGDWYVGGVVGYNNTGTVTNCAFSGSVSGKISVGGVVGDNGGSVTNCYNTGTVSGSYVGGVVGCNQGGSVQNCYNTGDVSGPDSGSDNNVGGVVGLNSGPVKNCYNTGTVTGPDSGTSNYVGGVVGENRNSASVINCYFLQTADVNSKLQGIGNDEDTEGATEKDDTAFHSGEVAWRLQDGQTAGSGQVWGQSNLKDENSWPTLIALDKNAKTVYKVITDFGYDEKPNDVSYTNNPAEPAAPPRDGYTFGGWDKTGEGTTTITYTAKWTPHTYSITASPSALDFGSITEGEERPAAQNVTITNSGNQTVTLTQPTANNFEITTSDSLALAPNATATFTVQPKAGLAAGSYSEEITISGSEVILKITATLTVSASEPTPTPSPDPTPSGPSTGDSTGWDDILDELENTAKGDEITIDMGDETKVPAEIFESLAGKDVDVTFDLGDDLSWTVNGKDIPDDAALADLDLGVALDTDGIPANVVNTITGEVGTVQITLAHDGEFGFTMTLTAPLGKENAGYWANLYHYDEDAEALNFEAAAKIDEDGSVTIPFSHASQYAIVIDTHGHATVDVSDIFIDVARDAWYKDAVQYAYDHGLMTGVSDTEFAPEQTTTRAMIVSILARLEGVESAQAAGFADVDDNDWYATAVNWAANVGVVNGYEDNTFQPNTAITREQLAAILMNYANYKGQDVSARASLDNYTDQPSTWAQEAISWSVAEGLLTGVTADTLQPQGAATRAQVAAILQRFLSE